MGNALEDQVLQRTGIRAVVKEGDFGVLVEGSIGSDAERRAAIRAIQDLAPSRNIIDRLEVVADPNTEVDTSGDVLLSSFGLGGMDDRWSHEEVEANQGDDAIFDAVQRVLREDELTGGIDIQVTVKQGRVDLRCGERSKSVTERARALASQVPGVLEVQADLTGR